MLFLVELVLGLVARAAPQTMSTIGFALKTGVAILAIAASIPLLPAAVETLVTAALSRIVSNDSSQNRETNSATLKLARGRPGCSSRTWVMGHPRGCSVLIPLYRMGTSTTRRAFAMLSALPTSPNIDDVSALGKEVMIMLPFSSLFHWGSLVLSVGASSLRPASFLPRKH